MSRDDPEVIRSPLEHSRRLPWDRTCSGPRWEEAVEHFLGLLEASENRQRARRSADRARLRSTLGAMMAALYEAWSDDKELWLAYSRNRNDYGPNARYGLRQATAELASTVADFLTAQGFAEHWRGYYRRNPFGPGGTGHRSRIKATAKLIARLQSRFGLDPSMIRIAPWTEVIRLKAQALGPFEPKQLIPYADTHATRTMRAELQAINALIASSTIELAPGMPAVFSDSAALISHQDDSDRLPVTRRSTLLYRVFNNGRWDHGGRFYGGWWQLLAKADRARITINGEATIELDFKSLHPRLCYQLAGAPLPPDADPYWLPGMETPERRELVKRALNQLINAPPRVRLRAPPGMRERLPRRLSYKRLLTQIEAAHQPIDAWFRSGRGVELQAIDSGIAAAVMGHLRHRGICCLPVHDSFIVPRSAEFILGQTMHLAYRGQLASRADARVWPVISGWSSPEMEDRVRASIGEA